MKKLFAITCTTALCLLSVVCCAIGAETANSQNSSDPTITQTETATATDADPRSTTTTGEPQETQIDAPVVVTTEEESWEPTTTTTSGERCKWQQDIPLSQELQDYIWQECKKADIPTSIVYAVIECESNFDENARSVTNDYGLMQLNEICHKELCERLKVPNVIDPKYNIRAGITLLSDYYHEYGNWNAALMAYNCGKYGAEALFKKGIKTTDYADKVLKREQKYLFE